MATRHQRHLHIVSTHGCLKARHMLAPEELKPGGVRVVTLVKKHDHDKTKQDDKDRRQSTLGSVCSSNATTDFSVVCSASNPPVSARVASFM